MNSAEIRRREKDAAARLRECLDQEIHHLRLGDWRQAGDTEVIYLGRASDLHGVICTCCPTRTENAA